METLPAKLEHRALWQHHTALPREEIRSSGVAMRKYLQDKHFIPLLSLLLFTVVGIVSAVQGDLRFVALFAVLWVITAARMVYDESKGKKRMSDERN